MKNLNKILALVIVLTMALGTVVFAGSFSDVSENESYSEAVEVMSALGLLAGYEDGTFGPDKTITRAEFATVIVRAIGMEDSAKGSVSATRFSDVPADNWAAGYVTIASQQGIIAGYPDGTFKPQNPVKFEEAVKMIVCALGYAPKFANVPNAYPTSYLAQANTSGITTGAMLSIGSEASRAIVARLVYNALDVDMMEQTSFGSDVEYSVPAKAQTLLSENLNVAKIEGFVSSVSFNNEDGNKLVYKITKVAKQYDSQDQNYKGPLTASEEGLETTFKYADGVKIQKYYSTVAYVDMSDDTDPVILAIVEKAGKNKTLTLTSKQTKGAEFKAADKKISYFKTSKDVDSNATEVKLATGFEIYANLNYASEDNDTFRTNYVGGKYPEVTLIDNNPNNNGYEIIYVTEYWSGIVSEINERTYRLSFDNVFGTGAKTALPLNPTADDYTFEIVDTNGAAVAFDDIKVNDVVNVFASKDGTDTFYKVVVTSDKLEGAISEVSDDNRYVIGGEEYDSVPKLQAGDAGIFYVDMYKRILKYEIGENSSRTFGVLYALYVDSNGVDNEPKAIIYTADGKFTTYDFAKNINYNGTNSTDDRYNTIQKSKITKGYNEDRTNTTAATNDIVAYFGDDSQRIVMYTVNSSNEISEIFWGDGIKYRDANYVLSTEEPKEEASYKKSSEKLESTIIPEGFKFVTLETATYQAADAKERAGFGTADTGVLNEDDKYTYQAVQGKDDKVAAFAVLFDLKAKPSFDSDVMFVTSVGKTNNSEGASANTIVGTVNGEKVTLIATDGDVTLWQLDGITRYDEKNTKIENLIKKGAVIQYAGEGEVSAIRVLATAAQIIAMGTTPIKLNENDEEDDDNGGFAYSGQIATYRGNALEFNDGKEITVSSSVPTMVVRGSNSVYASDSISIGIAERSGELLYDDDKKIIGNNKDSHAQFYVDSNKKEINDDYVFVYKFDGKALAAVIYDVDGDDQW